jgi:mono/diheme cytochrome c family protein
MRGATNAIFGWVASCLVLGGLVSRATADPPAVAASATTETRRSVGQFIERHCTACHSGQEKAAGLDLNSAANQAIGDQPELWEKVVRRLTARQMPPTDMPRPSDNEYASVVAVLTGTLDDLARRHPAPGRALAFRRLTRSEYQNAIRDLLDLEIDAAALLPPDESSHGFDNITVGDLSPTLLDRYLSAAQKISRLAVARPLPSPAGETIRIRADLTQEQHVAGLPLGTRGGALVPYTFPQGGEYEIQLRLARDRNEHIEGLTEPHELVVLVDRRQVASFTIKPPRGPKGHQTADQHLKARIDVTSGTHRLGVTFVKKPSSLLETKRQPYQAHFNFHRHPRISPALYQISITGPYSQQSGPADTSARRRLFVTRPAAPEDEEPAARQILSTLARRAYRRPVAEGDLRKPLELYRQARTESDFDTGIELAASAVLVNPNFLFRMERDPPSAAPSDVYRISDVELASRLSFFLWSSIPDDELLALAIDGRLSQPHVFEQQVRRLLRDPRSQSLVTIFASQWLQLRNLESITPDLRLFPDFDDNLRQAMRRETELHLESILREDRSAVDLIESDYTFLNERLAKHYGIPHVYGSRFRRVALPTDSQRGGLLRHASILTLTSYATRTSPVIRGKWILENLLGTPPPPPPANVPALKDNTVSSMLSVRQRLAEHRANAACASCHKLMDPPGFALEHFDSVGRWRDREEGQPIDASGGLPDGSEFVGADGLEKALLERPELLVRTLTEKLLTFALGRGLSPRDAPAVRQIVRQAKADEFRLSSIVLGIATSTPFTMRRAE